MLYFDKWAFAITSCHTIFPETLHRTTNGFVSEVTITSIVDAVNCKFVR